MCSCTLSATARIAATCDELSRLARAGRPLLLGDTQVDALDQHVLSCDINNVPLADSVCLL